MEYELGKRLDAIEQMLYAIAEKVGVIDDIKKENDKK